MSAFSILLPFTVLSAFAAPSSALPSDAATAILPVIVSDSRLDVDTLEGGTVWARGDDYKARFDARGVRYVPFLGSDAPQNYPVDLRVQGVSLGGAPISFDANAAAVVDGSSIVFDRGPFVERYLLTPQGVEQTIVFAELPRRGEIVVSIAVDTAMSGRADADGFRFENERGHVRYGRAFAFERGGEKRAIESRLHEREIQLVVPAERVAAAALPLTIDPLISSYNVTNGGPTHFAADTAFDMSNGVYFTVMEEIFSASDHDVRGVRHSETGAGLNIRFIDTSDANWTDPKVANNNFHGKFLVSATVGAAPTRGIWTRSVSADAGMVITAPADITAFFLPADNTNADISGDFALSANTRYCLVWELSPVAGVHQIAVTALAAPDGNVPGPAWVWTGATYGNPVVSNSNGSGPATERWWNIAWERETSPTNHDIFATRLNSDGIALDGVGYLADSPADERRPSTTAPLDDGGPWLLAFQTHAAAGHWDIETIAVQGVIPISSLDLSAQFPSTALDQIQPSCDTDGRQFVVSYVERATPLYTIADIKVSTLHAQGGVLGVNEGNVSVAPGLELDDAPSVFTRASAGVSSDNALIVFDRDMGATDDVFASVYDLPDGGPVLPYCFGDGTGSDCPCSNFGAAGHGCANSANAAGALLSSTGNAALGFDDSLTLQASGMPSSTTCLFFQGTGQVYSGNGLPFGDGLRCAAGSVIRLATRTAGGGAASYPAIGEQDISDRGLVPDAGGTRYYQVRYRNTASYCTPDGFNTTNGLRVTWLP